MAMLGNAPLLARCLLTATTLGGWEGGLSGSAQGLACHAMRGSYIALLATARPSDGGLQVEQLVAVVDAGRLVKIGRASCRDRVGHAVLISVVAGYLKNKKSDADEYYH